MDFGELCQLCGAVHQLSTVCSRSRVYVAPITPTALTPTAALAAPGWCRHNAQYCYACAVERENELGAQLAAAYERIKADREAMEAALKALTCPAIERAAYRPEAEQMLRARLGKVSE